VASQPDSGRPHAGGHVFPHLLLAIGIGGALLLPPSGLLAAQGGSGGPSEIVFLTQIVLLVLAGRALGEVALRIGQPAVIGQLIAGLILGPSVLGALWPEAQHAIFPPAREQKAMLDALSQFGVLLLLLLTGMETELKLVRRVGRAAISVSVTGICIPFACGFALGYFLPESLLPDSAQRVVTSLFLGTALSISSVKIVAMVVREMNFMRRNLGQVILASAVIDDTIGWIIIAITFAIAGQGELDPFAIAKSFVGTAVFLAVSLTLGRRVVFTLIRWANDHMAGEAAVMSLIILLVGAMALFTHLLGVHTVLGAFVAGILVGESPILTRRIDDQLRGLIMGLFAPIFFGTAGLSADLSAINTTELALLTAGLVVIASVGKFGGAFLGGGLGGLTLRESLALASGMNARGSTEVIVATIGLSIGVLSQTLFTMIVAMAIITTMAMPPMLRWALARVPLREDEQTRLEREEFEAQGFLPNVERVLVAADESASGRLASHVAGILAGAHGTPITLLRVGDDAPRKDKPRETEKTHEAAIRAAAKLRAASETEPREVPEKVEVTTRTSQAEPHEAVAREAGRGHDLLLLGIDKIASPDGKFSDQASALTAGFTSPLAIVVARGKALPRQRARLLLPVNGTESSRRAAEIAIAIARAHDVPITALYVTDETPKRGRGWATQSEAEALLKDVVALADRYDTIVNTAVRANVDADAAILREAERGRFDLTIMGVNRRPGEKLFFGKVPETVLAKAKTSLLFISA
jgi:Kef-type K+ transport system membrane component KefB/nucleotide-binding universal stress UspA family protein